MRQSVDVVMNFQEKILIIKFKDLTIKYYTRLLVSSKHYQDWWAVLICFSFLSCKLGLVWQEWLVVHVYLITSQHWSIYWNERFLVFFVLIFRGTQGIWSSTTPPTREQIKLVSICMGDEKSWMKKTGYDAALLQQVWFNTQFNIAR